MQISEIYKNYPVNKGLREHMYRVAAVVTLLCRYLPASVNTDAVITAALLHDMGNLVKTNFEIAFELFEPEGVKYWQKQKQKMIAQYGKDDHEVTVAIVKEIGVSELIITILNATGLEQVEKIANHGSLEEKIMMYADMRVGLTGVISLDARMDDVSTRYAHKHTPESLVRYRSVLHVIEQELFTDIRIAPADINDESTNDIQMQLNTRNISHTT